MNNNARTSFEFSQAYEKLDFSALLWFQLPYSEKSIFKEVKDALKFQKGKCRSSLLVSCHCACRCVEMTPETADCFTGTSASLKFIYLLIYLFLSFHFSFSTSLTEFHSKYYDD